MYLHDISNNIFTAKKYKGDPAPQCRWLSKMEFGEDCNLSLIEMCTHTGTHIDAPRHYLEDGKTIDQLPLSRFYGPCTVVSIEGVLTGEDMEQILPFCKKKILFKGNGCAFLSQSAVFVLADYGRYTDRNGRTFDCAAGRRIYHTQGTFPAGCCNFRRLSA